MTEKREMHKYKVGDGITECIGSDRYAGTVIAVSASGQTVTMQWDSSKCTDYHQQTYTHTRNETAPTRIARWSHKYQAFRNGSYRYIAGRHEYRDPHK